MSGFDQYPMFTEKKLFVLGGETSIYGKGVFYLQITQEENI